MDYVNSQQNDDSDDESSEDEEESPPPVRNEKSTKKRKANSSSDNNSSDDDKDSDVSDEKPEKKRRTHVQEKSKAKRTKKGDKGEKKTGGSKKGTGYMRPYQLSPQLAAVVGADCLPRHEVVKRVWAIIKERSLYDPKNKQFAICDSQLQSVMGVKRFRTFAMMKYLKTHFHAAS